MIGHSRGRRHGHDGRFTGGRRQRRRRGLVGPVARLNLASRFRILVQILELYIVRLYLNE